MARKIQRYAQMPIHKKRAWIELKCPPHMTHRVFRPRHGVEVNRVLHLGHSIARTQCDALFELPAGSIPNLPIVDLYKSKRSVGLSAFRIQFNRAPGGDLEKGIALSP